MSCTPQKTSTRPADDWADFDPSCNCCDCFLFQFIIKKMAQDSVSVHHLDVRTVFTCAISVGFLVKPTNINWCRWLSSHQMTKSVMILSSQLWCLTSSPIGECACFHLQVDHWLPVWQEVACETGYACHRLSVHQHQLPSGFCTLSPALLPLHQLLHL